MNADQKVTQYLGEAKASEDALVRVLQSQIAMTPSGSYRSGLETHLDETRDHSRRVGRRIAQLSGGRNPIQMAVGLAEEIAGQAIALGKTPLDLLRGSGGEEKVLKNAKDAAASEALEIATYTAIERLAQATGDDLTAQLAQEIREEEERMLALILREIPQLTDAMARAELGGDSSYDITRTGAADAVRDVADGVKETAQAAAGATRRTAHQARKVPGVAQAEGQLKGAVADEDDLAIHGYDVLNVDEINAKLPELSQIELARIDSYERRHADRTTVLHRVESLRGDEPWPGYDELTVADVQKALGGRTDEQVTETRAYEVAHKNRAGVTRAADRRLGIS